jgi:hypothetical protein
MKEKRDKKKKAVNSDSNSDSLSDEFDFFSAKDFEKGRLINKAKRAEHHLRTTIFDDFQI